MDFELTKAQKDIQKAAADFAKGEFDKEIAAELEAKHEFPVAIWKKAGELGVKKVSLEEIFARSYVVSNHLPMEILLSYISKKTKTAST